MSLFTALSGLNAAQTDISVTSNNIANVGTLGYHGSRAEFADIFTNNPSSRPATQVGAGVELSRIGVDFKQGTTQATGNVLDMSIQGPGFFQVRTGLGADDDLAYTRAGAFNMNDEGFVTNAAGQYLTVFPTAENGDTQSLTRTDPLRIPQEDGLPAATGRIDMSLRVPLDEAGGLGSQAAVPAAAFSADDPTTYAQRMTVPVLDDAGQPVPAHAFLVMSKAPDPLDPSISYDLKLMVDGELATTAGPAALTFDGNGAQTAGAGDMVFSLADRDLTMNLAESAAAKGEFSVTSVAQDGQSRRTLSAIEVAEDGVVWAAYGGEVSRAVGQVAIANFTDMQGLTKLGEASYMASNESGPVRLGTPGESGFGALRSGSVEQANVNLTEELVQLIMAQRNYQASAKALETNGKLSETVMNMRT